jgi:uncharacterized membrane protein YhaH (DUF805 family)
MKASRDFLGNMNIHCYIVLYLRWHKCTAVTVIHAHKVANSVLQTLSVMLIVISAFCMVCKYYHDREKMQWWFRPEGS